MFEPRLQILFGRYLDKTASAEEREELFGLSMQKDLQEELRELIQNASGMIIEDADMPGERTNQIVSLILNGTHQQAPSNEKTGRIIFWRRLVVAASILILLGTGVYFLLFRKSAPTTEVYKELVSTDIPSPTTNRATITLGDGKTIFLDSAANGSLGRQGEVQIKKIADGRISYSGAANQMIYNTLNNPRGSRVIDMVLSDGSRVWLNAGSSITYPVAFVEKERKVFITGEAYFEITKRTTPPNVATNVRDALSPSLEEKQLKSSDRWPFIVANSNSLPREGSVSTAAGWAIEVLGTHFNVNAYNDEPTIKVTLVEGSVNVKTSNANGLLKPGQQTQLLNNGQLTSAKEINIDEVAGWKEGWFHFESADLKTILRQFARWYDVEVIYEGTITNRKFFGIVKRSSTLKTVLEMLQDNNIVYTIEGKKLIVKKG